MPVKLKCLMCGNEFNAEPSEAKRGAKFCSRKCYERYRHNFPHKNWQTRICEICGKAFNFYPTVREHARFCSLKCKYEGQRLFMFERYKGKQKFWRGEEYSSSASFRITIRNYLPKKCEICGWDKTSNDVCHIIPLKEGGRNSIDNVIMLCPNHHRMLDKGPLQRDYLISLVMKRGLSPSKPEGAFCGTRSKPESPEGSGSQPSSAPQAIA